MTREEEILEYANSFKGKGMEGEELKEIIRLAIIDGAKWADKHPIKPSLPSNLDEAAEEYGRNIFINQCMENGVCDGHDLSDAFNAGVEWEAGQGETIEGEVVKDINNNLVVTAKGLSMKDVKFGDKVIVQIRKK